MKLAQAKITNELHALAAERSKLTGVSVSHVIRRALEAWVDQYDPNNEGVQTMVVSGIKGQSFAEQRQIGICNPSK